ncbi:caspase, EACC1-associated type [Streptomyces melanosporofaciens]|uniref:Peptide/nickel transport system substrate-binding protein n=1 Tax=Streptomyces melanosporofaciens TaxID=67327 RepID=A0A1H4SUG2_STRMJ|nr:ABC transporter substrate-binding protein [Streptomyces melanosporofaciens]SEC47777.1 peptide/nickel transport system substrate-binding protein [Streptomyces melanosporofaciens]
MAVLPDPSATRAVLIGTSRYAHLEQIPAVANNLSALAAALCAPGSWGLAPEHCTVIEDPATAVEVLDAIRTAAEEATDTLLVYFAGHGLVEPRRGELFLGLTGSIQHRSYTGLPYGTLRDVVLDGRAGRQVMLLDCCFSGRVLGFMGAAAAEAVIDQVEIEGTYLLASVPDTSFALAPPGERHTAFTGELLRLLRQGVPGGPELLDLDTVYAQVYAALRAKGRPLPQKRDRNTAGGLALARNAAWAPPGFGPPPPPYDHEPAASAPSAPEPVPLPEVPPMPTWSPMALPSPAPLPAPGGASPGRRRAVAYGLAGALFVALVAAGIPLAMSWMKGSSKDDSGHNTSKSSSTPKPRPTSGNNAAAEGGVVNPSTKSGGTLKFISKDDADSWDPQRSYYGFVWNFSRYYARQLVTYAPKPGKDGTELVPDLAERKAEVTDGGKTYTYTLRAGITWEDGTAITSQDIKYGIERIWAQDDISGGPTFIQQALDPGLTYKGPYKDTSKDKLGLKAIQTPDDRTIVFKLPKANGDFERMLATPSASPVKKTKDTKGKYQDNPFSSGPYKFGSYEPRTSLELIRNTEWKRASDPIRTALPDRITVNIGSDEQTNTKALFAGDYDLDLESSGLTAASLAQATSSSGLRARLDSPSNGSLLFAALPRSVKPLNNVHCRKAVLYAADRENMRTAAGGSQTGDIAPHMLPPTIVGSDSSYDPYGTLHNKGKPDTEKAEAELKACGEPNGFRTTIAVRNNRPAEVAVAMSLQASLRKVGITTEVAQVDGSRFSETMGAPATVKKKGYGIVLYRWLADFPTGQSFLQPLADSRFILPTGNFNVAELDDPTVDDLFDTAIAEQDPAKAGSDYAQINRRISDSAAYLPILFQKSVIWRGSRLTNVYTSEPWEGRYDYVSLGVSE